MREMCKRTGWIKESREGNMMKSGHGEKNNRKKKKFLSLTIVKENNSYLGIMHTL